MLSRVAERVYWMARYLERIENTARLINSYTTLLLDAPDARETDWVRLIDVFNATDTYFEKHDEVNENDVMHFLITNENTPFSLVTTMKSLRENARTSMDVLPEILWEQVNELHRLIKSELSSISNRRRRQRLLVSIMELCQGILGVINNQMNRNHAYDFLLAGKYLERADMTSRILELAAIFINKNERGGDSNKRVWSILLSGLGAHQMYIQSYQLGIEADKVINFLMMDKRFPRSLHYSLNAVGNYLQLLPSAELVIEEQKNTLLWVDSFESDEESIEEIQVMMDALQLSLSKLNSAISDNWFYPDTIDYQYQA